MSDTSNNSSRKRTYPHVSLIIVILYSPPQSGHAVGYLASVLGSTSRE
jgi:hypothetical protein